MQEVTQVPHTLFMIFTIAVVFSVVVQAAVFLGTFFLVAGLVKKVSKIADDLTAKVGPIITQVGGIVSEVEPKVRTVTSQVVEITSAVRDQTMHVNSTVDEVVGKTQAQVHKVDEMVSAVIGTIAHAGTAVQSGVSRPVRKVTSFMRGVRVGAESLFRSETQHAGAGVHDSPRSPLEYEEQPEEVIVPAAPASSDATDQAAGDATDQRIQPPAATSSAR